VKDIIILGMGPSRIECPFDCETWGVNNGYRQVIQLNGRLDKLFICHRGQEKDWEDDDVFNWDELNNLKAEIISLFDVKEIKKKTRIPFRTLKKKFDTEYYTDTIVYMVAYALHKNTTIRNGILKLKEPMRLRFYGVDMHTQDEYNTERAGIEYFIAIAKTIGVEVWIHPDSALCKTDHGVPYGFWKLNKKKVDPLNVMELQKTPEGVRKLWKMDKISAKEMEVMLKHLETTRTA